jgi:hypothetical protein
MECFKTHPEDAIADEKRWRAETKVKSTWPDIIHPLPSGVVLETTVPRGSLNGSTANPGEENRDTPKNTKEKNNAFLMSLTP